MIMTALDAGGVADLAAALSGAGLPTSYLTEPGHRFFRFEDEHGLIGYGGFEGSGADRLLRSMVVTPDRRNAGAGERLLAALERAAADDGITHLLLLTTTAEPFFRRHGYEVRSRDAAPEAVSASAEFRALCPASAAFMSKQVS